MRAFSGAFCSLLTESSVTKTIEFGPRARHIKHRPICRCLAAAPWRSGAARAARGIGIAETAERQPPRHGVRGKAPWAPCCASGGGFVLTGVHVMVWSHFGHMVTSVHCGPLRSDAAISARLPRKLRLLHAVSGCLWRWRPNFKTVCGAVLPSWVGSTPMSLRHRLFGGERPPA